MRREMTLVAIVSFTLILGGTLFGQPANVGPPNQSTRVLQPTNNTIGGPGIVELLPEEGYEFFIAHDGEGNWIGIDICVTAHFHTASGFVHLEVSSPPPSPGEPPLGIGFDSQGRIATRSFCSRDIWHGITHCPPDASEGCTLEIRVDKME